MNFIKSPLNYTGNKYRILPQIMPHLPQQSDLFIDLFSGGATVGLNVNAKVVVFIDYNEKVMNLLRALYETSLEEILMLIEEIIEEYKLSYSLKYGYSTYREQGFVKGNNGLKAYNEEGYYKLRVAYNMLENKNNLQANIMLYVLMIYGFNNDIRFNGKGEFNMPVGKTDFNKSNYRKLKEFKESTKDKNYIFMSEDFKSDRVNQLLKKADFIYADPPYILTNAVYNGKNYWTEVEELALLELLLHLDRKDKKFALSNVLETSETKNDALIKYIDQNRWQVVDIDYHYRSASYNKLNRNKKEREVLVFNDKD